MQVINGPKFSSLFRLRFKQLAWFLGAGASASAGIPTGNAMIQDFKKRLFCQLSNIRLKDVDSHDPLWIERIENFFNIRNVIPPANDPSEYAVAFEAVYPTPEDRRLYIEEAIKKGTPSFAHRVMAALITNKNIPCVFTTNFDSLVETETTIVNQLLTTDQRIHLTAAAIDNADRARHALNESRPFLAKLHGDFQSVELKNTKAELQEQDLKMRQVLIDAASRYGLVIAGYSGRDDSIMDALTESLNEQNPYPGGVFWVTRSKNTLLPRVIQFLEQAKQKGILTEIVECQTFDELTADIAEEFDFPPVLENYIFENRPEPILREVPMPETSARPFPVLLCSAVPMLDLPTTARKIEINTAISTSEVRKMVKEAKIDAVAISLGKEIVAFGSDKELIELFSKFDGRISGTITLNPKQDSWALGILYDSLIKAICRDKPLFPLLRNKGHCVIVSHGFFGETPDQSRERNIRLTDLKSAYSNDLFGKIKEIGYPYNEGVEVRMINDAGRWWCVFDPFTNIKIPTEKTNSSWNENLLLKEPSNRSDSRLVDWNRERWARRYNKAWSNIISAWSTMLAGKPGDSISAIGLDGEGGVDAIFKLSPIAGWSRPSHEHDYFLRETK